jgi:mannose-1-phosphate guanylyltransferase/mannose-6-phosphate isomerase
MAQVDLITPVILCGGSGTRLWPLSRLAMPKQFLPLHGETTMLQETVQRFTGDDFAAPWYLCGAEHRFLVASQLQETGLPTDRILLEPAARGTAPAAALAALAALDQAEEDDPLLLVTPADHVVGDTAGLRAAIRQAAPTARAGWLVVFGIAPTGPETGYGYIKSGDHLTAEASLHQVTRFIEKPPREKAEAMLAEGGHYWNSGIFLFLASRYLAELERFQPAIMAACRAAMAGRQADLDFIRIDAAAFDTCPPDAIDTAVMEHTGQAAVLPVQVGWNDVGTWSALWEIGERDSGANVQRGRVFARDTTGSYLRSDGPLLATLGVTDMLVVATEDAVLVAPRERAQDLRQIVETLRQENCTEIEQNRTVQRPWGSYRSIDAGARFQVKHILVNPGASLSLQMHHHRAEHWVVVNGMAQITRGDETFLLGENESTYIPLGIKHRLENPGKSPLSLIEIQSGSYLGEDDIVRFEDKFGRV